MDMDKCRKFETYLCVMNCSSREGSTAAVVVVGVVVSVNAYTTSTQYG